MFLRMLEETVGRDTFDDFLKTYFSEHAFSVMDTDNFIAYMNANLLITEELKEATRTSEWIDGKGLPSNCPVVTSDRIEAVVATKETPA